MNLNDMIDATIGREGRYSNNPADPGGETMYGITVAVARANGYTGDMRAMPRSVAVAIYRQEYAIKPGFAAVADVMPSVGAELFDTGVNMGVAVPSMWLQRCLNALNDCARLYPDIKVDGNVGPATIATLRKYADARGADAEKVLLTALNALQGERYIELAEKRSANEHFLFGWLRARVAA